MRVSLRPPALHEALSGTCGSMAPPLLDPSGPLCVLGSNTGGSDLVLPVSPSATTMFGPRGAALASEDGPLFAADTGHHRLLVWRQRPLKDHTPADFCIGQPSFTHEGRNAKGTPNAATFNVPTGVAATKDILAVADAWNHRILIWHGLPESPRAADVVLGQDNFYSTEANRGGEPGANTLNWCYGTSIIGSALVVCDTGNRRVLIWHEIPTSNGTPADIVLGQNRMNCRDENGGLGIDASGMRWPHSAAVLGKCFIVADSGNNRLMAWNEIPTHSGTPCDFILGQKDVFSSEHNRAIYLPGADAVNMPYGCAALGDQLAIADTANSRLVGYKTTDLVMGAPASSLTGQDDFQLKGDNRWKQPVRDSLCWPYGITATGTLAVVSDSGNNRVLLWGAAR